MSLLPPNLDEKKIDLAMQDGEKGKLSATGKKPKAKKPMTSKSKNESAKKSKDKDKALSKEKSKAKKRPGKNARKKVKTKK